MVWYQQRSYLDVQVADGVAVQVELVEAELVLEAERRHRLDRVRAKVQVLKS